MQQYQTFSPCSLWVAVCVLAYCGGIALAQDPRLPPVVNLSDTMMVRGVYEGDVAVFRGIPYGKCPCGTRRWAPPEAFPAWNGTRNATEYGSACVQPQILKPEQVKVVGSEDCLFLNVYAPASVIQTTRSGVQKKRRGWREQPIPVAFVVHGGAYTFGSASDPIYNATNLVSYWGGRGIVVTANYRLGIFGFLGSTHLRQRDTAADPTLSPGNSTGNYGIQDQRLAMKWVQQHIGAFQGDKDRVTLVGSSTGAGSISNHLVAKLSWPYFHAAVMESGSFSPWVTQPMGVAEDTYSSVEIYCGGPPQLHLNQTAEKLVLCSIQAQKTHATFIKYSPVVDGHEMDHHPWITMTTDAQNGVRPDTPLLHGANLDDAAILLYDDVPMSLDPQGLSKFLLGPGSPPDDAGQDHWPDQGDGKRHFMDFYINNITYPTQLPNATAFWWGYQRFLTDQLFTCPAIQASLCLSAPVNSSGHGCNAGSGAGNNNIYLYHFRHRMNSEAVSKQQQQLVMHGFEMPFMFRFPPNVTMSGFANIPPSTAAEVGLDAPSVKIDPYSSGPDSGVPGRGSVLPQLHQLNASDLQMSNNIASWWGNFVVGGNPQPNPLSDGGLSVAKWPAFNLMTPTAATSPSESVSLAMETDTVVVQLGLKDVECSYINSILQTILTNPMP